MGGRQSENTDDLQRFITKKVYIIYVYHR